MYEMGETQQLLQHRCITNPIIIFFFKIILNMAKTAFGELKDVFVFKYAYSAFAIFLIHSERKASNLWVTQILWKAKQFPLGLCLTIPNERSHLRYAQNCLKIGIVERLLSLPTFCRNRLLSVVTVMKEESQCKMFWHTYQNYLLQVNFRCFDTCLWFGSAKHLRWKEFA